MSSCFLYRIKRELGGEYGKGCRCGERLLEELKLEDGEASHTLGGAGEGGT